MDHTVLSANTPFLHFVGAGGANNAAARSGASVGAADISHAALVSQIP